MLRIRYKHRQSPKIKSVYLKIQQRDFSLLVDWRNRLNNELETKNIPLPYDNIMIEVTRRCNLRCEHCMRGEPQNIDMSDKVLDKIIEQFSMLNHLSLTGGEPFLVPDVIEKLVDKIISNKKKVWRLTTVDNGTILDERGIRCIEALNRLALYIYNDIWSDEARNDYKEGATSKPVHVSISNSKYHVNDIQKAIELLLTKGLETSIAPIMNYCK